VYEDDGEQALLMVDVLAMAEALEKQLKREEGGNDERG
jgi:hypothetical protein